MHKTKITVTWFSEKSTESEEKNKSSMLFDIVQ